MTNPMHLELNLHNLCVLVTRPQPQGDELCKVINAHHGRAVSFPTIAFAKPPDSVSYQQALASLSNQKYIIFVSPQAVHASMADIQQTWPNFPGTTKLAAIGAGTATVLQQAGYEVNLYPSHEWNSDALLNLPEFQQVKDIPIAIVRGVGGREKVDQELAARGAIVLPVIAYERILPTVNITPTLELLKKGMVDCVICTSFDSVRHFKILLGEAGWPYIQPIPMIVISERIKMLAHDLGFRRIWVTHHASQAAILNALAQRRIES